MKSADLFDLSGKVALVTGARTGLGQAMAVALADAGADIIGLGSSAMPDTRKRIEALGRRFEEIICDLSFGSEFRHRSLRRAVGSIDILVNNAGIIRRADFLDMTEADWDEVLDRQPAQRLHTQPGRGAPHGSRAARAASSTLPRSCPSRAASGLPPTPPASMASLA